MHISWSDEVAPYPDGLKKTYPFWIPALKKTHGWLDIVRYCILILMLWQGARPTLKPAHSLKVFSFWMKQRKVRGVVSQTGSWIKAAKQKQVHPGPVQTALLVPIEWGVQAEKFTLDDVVCSRHDSYIGIYFVSLTFLRCILFCFLPAQRWEA